MNDELQKSLAIILQKTTAAATAGVDFLSEQLPDVIRQLLLWNAVRSAMFFLLFFLVAMALIIISAKAWRFSSSYIPKDFGDDTAGWSRFGGCLAGVFSVLFFVLAICNMEWMQIWLAPKLYLIEYTARILK